MKEPQTKSQGWCLRPHLYWFLFQSRQPISISVSLVLLYFCLTSAQLSFFDVPFLASACTVSILALVSSQLNRAQLGGRYDTTVLPTEVIWYKDGFFNWRITSGKSLDGLTEGFRRVSPTTYRPTLTILITTVPYGLDTYGSGHTSIDLRAG